MWPIFPWQWGETPLLTALKQGSATFLKEYTQGIVDNYVVTDEVTNFDGVLGMSPLNYAFCHGAWEAVLMLAQHCENFQCANDFLYCTVDPRPRRSAYSNGPAKWPSVAPLLRRLTCAPTEMVSDSGPATADGEAASTLMTSPPESSSASPSTPSSPPKKKKKTISILDAACLRGADTLASLLLASHKQWTPHRSPLHCAARLGHSEAIRVLLAGGWPPDHTDTEHAEATAKAEAEIIKACAELENLSAAATAAQRALADAGREVKSLRERRAAAAAASAVDAADADAALAAALAAEHRCRAKAAMSASALSDAKSDVWRKRTAHAELVGASASPLHLLALAGCGEVAEWESYWDGCDAENLLPDAERFADAAQGAKLLLGAGADVASPDASKRTPLHWAARSANLELVRCSRGWGDAE